jgi:hypothetical protein
MSNLIPQEGPSLLELQKQLSDLDEVIYDELERTLHIPKNELKNVALQRVISLVEEVRLQVLRYIENERAQSSKISAERQSLPAGKKVKSKVSHTHPPESPKDALERVVNVPAADFFEWKYNDNVEQRIVSRGINLLRTLMRFLIDHPDGLQKIEEAG